MVNENDITQNAGLVRNQVKRLKGLIAELYVCCRGRILYEANEFDLPPTELKCLMLFEEHKYLSCGEIAKKLEVAKSRACVVIESLEKKMFIRRTSDPNDARIKLVSLSPKGHRKMDEVENYIFHLHHQLLTHIPISKRAAIIDALEVLNASMKDLKAKMAS